jgi:pilus assembly protein Flp/PilA
MNTLCARFVKDESGATAIEYGLIAALMFLAIVGGVNSVANNTKNMHNKIANVI